MLRVLFLLSLCLGIQAFAQDEAMEVDYIRDVSDEVYRKNAKLHKGEGIHQCQSETSIGHTCRNLGVNFMDCNQAFYLLKRDDCCPGSTFGGVSISFKMVKCSTIY